MFLWKALPGLPSFASLIVYAASTLPAYIALWISTEHQRGLVIASCQEHCGAVLRGTNSALSLPTDIAQWRGTGQQRSPVVSVPLLQPAATSGFSSAAATWLLASCHCTGGLYGAPTLLCHCQPSSHCGAVLWGTNAASTLPAIMALWNCTTGHQLSLDIALPL